MSDVTIPELEAMLIALAPRLDTALNGDEARRIGFCFIAFEFGEPGSALAYISNADRDDLKNSLVELLERMDATLHTVGGRADGSA